MGDTVIASLHLDSDQMKNMWNRWRRHCLTWKSGEYFKVLSFLQLAYNQVFSHKFYKWVFWGKDNGAIITFLHKKIIFVLNLYYHVSINLFMYKTVFTLPASYPNHLKCETAL